MILRFRGIFAGMVRHEQGTVLILFAIVLIPLITVVGLAIDSGNIYRAKLAQQNAADAAALASVNFISVKGKIEFEKLLKAKHCPSGPPTCFADLNEKSSAINEFFQPFVDELVRSNMAAAGYPHLPDEFPITATPEFSYAPDPESTFDFTVTVSRRIDLLLMDVIPSVNQNSRVLASRASSRRKRAKAALVLDFSESMTCPAEGSCDCKLPSMGGCPPGDARIDVLIDATKNFLKMFWLERDLITLVPFNTAALSRSISQLKNEYGFGSKDLSEEAIDSLAEVFKAENTATGATNICDGLMRAWGSLNLQLQNEGVSNQDLAYVFFSDGAPTAARLLFSDPVSAPFGLPPFTANSSAAYGFDFGSYDYIHHTISWEAGNITRLGPSLLLQTGYYGFGYGIVHAQIIPGNIERGVDADSSAKPAFCTGSPSQAPPVGVDLPQEASPPLVYDQASAAAAVFSPCLKSASFHLPGDPAAVFGSDVSFENWRQLYYHCAIEMSDFLRKNGGKVYVVGYGEKWNPIYSCDPTNPTCSPGPVDAYEDLDNLLFRKDIFLNRIALDITRSEKEDLADFDYSGYANYADWKEDSPDKAGKYYPTSDAQQIKILFGEIARDVLLKLVS